MVAHAVAQSVVASNIFQTVVQNGDLATYVWYQSDNETVAGDVNERRGDHAYVLIDIREAVYPKRRVIVRHPFAERQLSIAKIRQ